MLLFPFAVIFFCFYCVGFPLFTAFVIFTNKRKLKEDQLLRAMGIGNDKATNPRSLGLRKKFHKLYYHFKPGKVYWILVIIARKFFVAMAALMFQNNPSFQLSFIILVLFASFVLQVKNHPFMSSVEKETEIEKHKQKVEEEKKAMRLAEEKGNRYLGSQKHIMIDNHIKFLDKQLEVSKKRRAV